MERNITIISTKTNGRKIFKSSATTLGELKKDCDKNGVQYSGMTFFEGITKTEMKSDDSLLPTNVRYKDKVTNDLVFMLTAPQAKVRSGEMTRSEVLNEIKRLGLASKCIEKFGKNMTQCKTVDLINMIEEAKKKGGKPAPKKETPKPEAKKPVEKKENTCTCKKDDKKLAELMECLKALVEPLKVVLEKVSEYAGIEMPVTIEINSLDSGDVEDIIKGMR